MDPKNQKPAASETPSKEVALAKENDALKAEIARLKEDADRRVKDAEGKAAASLEKANAAAEGSAFRADILAAVSKLKHSQDADWQEDGRPSLKRIIALVGNDKVTADDVDKVAPNVRREAVKADNDKASAAALKKDADDDAPAMLSDVRVRAIKRGQYGGKVREVGEEFTYSGPKRSWFIKLRR